MPLIAEYEPPEHVAEWLKTHPDGIHADHRGHRRTEVWNERGESLSGDVRWLSPSTGRACVFVRDADGFKVEGKDGHPIEREVSARGWSYRRKGEHAREWIT